MTMISRDPDCFWLAYSPSPSKATEIQCGKKPIIDDEEPNDSDDVSTEPSVEEKSFSKETLFECSTCSASFIRMRNLVKHQDTGKHKVRPEVVSLHDSALNLYGRNLEELQQSTILKEVDDSLAALINRRKFAEWLGS